MKRKTLSFDWRYFSVIAYGRDSTDKRFNKQGLSWTYYQLVYARNKTEAREKVRKNKIFRRLARQNKSDWRGVELYVERTGKSDLLEVGF